MCVWLYRISCSCLCGVLNIIMWDVRRRTLGCVRQFLPLYCKGRIKICLNTCTVAHKNNDNEIAVKKFVVFEEPNAPSLYQSVCNEEKVATNCGNVIFLKKFIIEIVPISTNWQLGSLRMIDFIRILAANLTVCKMASRIVHQHHFSCRKKYLYF